MAKVFTTDNFETEVLNAEKPGADRADVRLRLWKNWQK